MRSVLNLRKIRQKRRFKTLPKKLEMVVGLVYLDGRPSCALSMVRQDRHGTTKGGIWAIQGGRYEQKQHNANYAYPAHFDGFNEVSC